MNLKKSLFFHLWFIFYSTIAIVFFNLKTSFTKDEKYYLNFVDFQDLTQVWAKASYDGYHIFQPMWVFIHDKYFAFIPIVLFNLLITYFSLRMFIKNFEKGWAIFLLSFFPSCIYCATYLKEPFLFAVTLLTITFLIKGKTYIALAFSLLLANIRIYWTGILLLVTFFKNFNFRYLIIFSLLFIYFVYEYILYFLNLSQFVSSNLFDIPRVFLSPLPAISYEGDVNLYENAILYSLTFPIRFIITFLLPIVMIFDLVSKKNLSETLIADYIFQIGIIMLIISWISGLIGPRQIILGQSLIALALFSRININLKSIL
tara:strand:+ start:7180 stop:8127 length:948 start_codon:yes stop_codon:yes gene_type:complete